MSEISKMIQAEVYPQLLAKLIANSKDPASFLSWEKLKSRPLLHTRHWMIFFGQSELLKGNGELVACRMIDALMWRHNYPARLYSDDFASLLGILSQATTSAEIKQISSRLKTIVDLALQTLDDKVREFDGLQTLLAHVEKILRYKIPQ